MAELYPELEPFEHGLLDVGEGHRLYWEMCGNPRGKPALMLHGGPGSGCSPTGRRFFDPSAYCAVLFDQRGCGRSAPLAEAPDTDLSTNTTHHLIADIERLRNHLGIERWLVMGGSWGSTLGLAYAERFPERVTEMVLFLVATTTAKDVEWTTRGVGIYFPEALDRLERGVPEADRSGNLALAYNRLLMHPDPAVHEPAAKNWCDWEMAMVAIHPGPKGPSRYDDPVFRLRFARLVTHYWANAAWLPGNILLDQVDRLAGTPAVLIHGRLDLGAPLMGAWQLSRRWPGSRLVVVEQGGHSTGDPGMSECIVDALDGFRTAGP